jgi:hypothetical protein
MTLVKRKRSTRAEPKPPEDDEPRPRRKLTDDMVELVHLAMAEPGKWVRLNRAFKTRENAHSTASCIRRGFLRVRPQDGDPTFVLGEHTYLALPAKPEVKVEQADGAWQLSLRVA